MPAFRTETPHRRDILIQLFHIESTIVQATHHVQSLLAHAPLLNFIQPIYAELMHFRTEAFQLHYLLLNISQQVYYSSFWHNISQQLSCIKSAFIPVVHTISWNLDPTVNTYWNTLHRVKAMRSSLQAVYISICNSVFSLPTPYLPHLQTQQPHSSNLRKRELAPTVYLVHAGEDKHTIALPLWTKLSAQGIHTFLDRAEMQPGDDKELVLSRAMDTAQVCVVITSPEMVAKKWPMLEVEHFLYRARAEGANGPAILPVFYRLCINDCYGFEYLGSQDENGRNLFIKWGFFNRVMSGNISLQRAVGCLRELTGKVGVENDEKASNEDSEEMRMRREFLIKRVAREVFKLIHKRTVRT